MICENCSKKVSSVVLHGSNLWCWGCHNETKGPITPSTGIIPDSIVGGVLIKHGICYEDGSPRRFDSKSEIRRAAFEAGLFQGDDTPKVNERLNEANQTETRPRNR